MMSKTAWAIAWIFALSYAPNAAATMRCGTHVIERGDSVVELISSCGQPLVRTGYDWVYVAAGKEPYYVRMRRGTVWGIRKVRPYRTHN